MINRKSLLYITLAIFLLVCELNNLKYSFVNKTNRYILALRHDSQLNNGARDLECIVSRRKP